jgi:kynurenine 3-monooxygenase
MIIFYTEKNRKVFSDRHPDKWIPLYSRVTFSDRPYTEALAIGDFKWNYAKVLLTENIEQIWDSKEVENKILELLVEFNFLNKKPT